MNVDCEKKSAPIVRVSTGKKTLSEKMTKLYYHVTNLAYTRDQLVDVFLDFLDPYEDFDNVEPCKQELNIDIAVFLNSFIDHIETQNKDESNKLIAYQIIKLISKADGFIMKENLKILELKTVINDEILNPNCL
ncbi:15363_t:CDS:2, partial [Cetraspora pellucida]